MRLDIFHHYEPSPDSLEILRQLKRVINLLLHLERKADALMAVAQDIKDLITKVDVATTKIAERITELMDQLDGGVSASEAEEIKSQLQPLVDQLEAMGKDPNDPVPPPPPPPVP